MKVTKLLFTTPLLRYPYAGGPEMSVHNAIKALSRICELHVVARLDLEALGGAQAFDYYRKLSDRFTLLNWGSATSRNRVIRKLQRWWFKVFARRNLEAVRKYLIKYCSAHSIDAIWFDRHEYSYDLICLVKTTTPHIKIVCDTAAVQSEFILRELAFQSDAAKREKILSMGQLWERREKTLLNLADVTTAVSEVDARHFRTLTPYPERVMVFSNVVDFDAYQSKPVRPKGFQVPSIVLAGTFYGSNSPMENGARWFITKVLPLVRQKAPGVHLYIVGHNSDQILKDVVEPGISITGRVVSVLPYISHATLAIVPLKFESGTRFKILEAGAVGLPVVSTTLGAEGLEVTHGKDVLIADDEQAFAEGVDRLLQSPEFAGSLGGNLKQLVRQKYSIESLVQEGNKILDFLLREESR